MTRPDISALTIARGRADHLRNLVRGLARQSVLPRELVIGAMQDAPFADLPDAPFPIRQILVPGDDLPLAAARNAAAAAASGALLVFLDVDCIPAPDCLAGYAAAADGARGLYMGEVLYLPGGATDDGLDYARFAALAEAHPDRRGPPETGREPCADYRCFWSLNFAISAEDWAASGGFDERYRGYGGEDTDFGRHLSEAGVPLWWVAGARAYHQHHAHAMPPLHHLDSVVRNAELFASKWGHRTMEHWLYAFRLMGLIDTSSGRIEILREPSEEELALCRQERDQPFVTTRRVLDALQGLSGREGHTRARRDAIAAAEAEIARIAAE